MPGNANVTNARLFLPVLDQTLRVVSGPWLVDALFWSIQESPLLGVRVTDVAVQVGMVAVAVGVGVAVAVAVGVEVGVPVAVGVAVGVLVGAPCVDTVAVARFEVIVWVPSEAWAVAELST